MLRHHMQVPPPRLLNLNELATLDSANPSPTPRWNDDQRAVVMLITGKCSIALPELVS